MNNRLIPALILAFLAAPGATAQERAKLPPLEAEVNPGATEAFREQLAPVIQAYSSGDAQKSSEAIQTFYLASPEAWIAQNFGAEHAKELVLRYAKALVVIDRLLAASFGPQKASAIGRITVTETSDRNFRASSANSIVAPKQPITTEAYEINVQMKDETLHHLRLLVLQADGAYRFLGTAEWAFWERPRTARIRVGGNVQSMKLIRQVRPVYPEAAKNSGVTGTVRIHVLIDLQGDVSAAEAVSGPEPLVQAALDAVRQWQYQPTLLNGEPVEVETYVEIVFTVAE